MTPWNGRQAYVVSRDGSASPRPAKARNRTNNTGPAPKSSRYSRIKTVAEVVREARYESAARVYEV